MSLNDLLKVIPGYVSVCIHTETKGWPSMSVGTALGESDFRDAKVVKVTPIAPYMMEIGIKFYNLREV